MSRIDNWLGFATEQLCAAGQSMLEDNPKLDAQLILAHCLQQTRTYLYTYPEAVISDTALTQAKQLLDSRISGTPMAYLLGECEFWGLTLNVSKHTLIPRADTETLVEWALELELPQQAKVLDLGTGSGAIALALAYERPDWQVTGVDFLAQVVELAHRNKQKNQLNNVEFNQSDWYENISGKFDLIISNPPYIEADDVHLSQGDVMFEPKTALVAEDNGLADIKQIIQHAPKYLNDQGWLLLEHGYNQGNAVKTLFSELVESTQPTFNTIQQRKDLGGNIRATGAKKRCA